MVERVEWVQISVVSSIVHRGVSTGLEVANKAFVGDDAGFLYLIQALSDLNVDVAARFRNG